jgi:competence protein ComEC
MSRPDLRLLTPAVATWLAAIVCLHVAPAAAGWAAAVMAVVAVGLAVRRAPAFLIAVLICAGATCVATSARVHARTTGVVHDAASHGSAVTVEAVLLDDPRTVTPTGGGVLAVRDLVVARLRIERLTTAGRVFAVRSAVVVVSSDRAWLRLVPSQHVQVEGLLHLPDRGGDVAALLSQRGDVTVSGHATTLQRAASQLRLGLRRAVAPLPPAERGLLPGLVDGDVSALPPQLQDDFRTVGLTHLVAVSGTNVAIVLAAVLLVCVRIGVPLRLRPPLCLLALVGFVILVRPTPSVLRAAVMGTVAMLALTTGRRRAALPTLSAAVVVLLLVSPDLAVSAGFALSVLATGGILVLAPGWRDRLTRRLPLWLAEALAVPAAAQVVCGPVVVALSAQLGLLSVPANLLAVPAVAPATILGLASAAVAPVSTSAATVLAWAAWVPTTWLVHVATTGAAMPGATLPWRGGAAGAALLVIATATAAVVLRVPRLRRLAAAGTVGVLLAVLVLWLVAPPWPPPGWVLVACDVGQGDGLVLNAGGHTAVVIDTGPEPRAIDRCLRRLHVHRVPLVILTHLHADHVEGLPGVLPGRHVREIEIGPLDEPVVEHARVLRWAAAARVPIVRAVVGEERRIAGARWQVLAPDHAHHGTDSDPNNSSLVLRLTAAGGRTVLLTGDVEKEAQQVLLDLGIPLRADILKVPHHGSSHQLPAFLAAVHPQITMTSVGAGNPFGHPSPTTIAQLVNGGARSYRTDRDGDIALVDRNGAITSEARRGPGTVAPPPRASPLERIPGTLLTARADALSRLAANWCATPLGPPARAPPWDDVVVPTELLSPLTLVVGDEELLVSRAVSQIVAAARATEPDVDVRELEGGELVPGDLVDLLSPSLFAERRVLVLRAAEDLGKDISADLLDYVAKPLDEVSLVVVHAGGAKGKALLAALQKAADRALSAARVTRPGERRDFLRGELRADGRQVDEEAVGALLDAVGNDLRELASAASQLLSDTDGPITVEAVARYHRGRAEANGFAVAERAVEGDLAGALELVRWWSMVKLEHVLVTSALANTLRSMAMVASAGRGPASVLAGQLGMPSWKVE